MGTTRGKPRSDAGYLANGDDPLALTELDRRYGARDGDKASVFRSLGTPKLREYWGDFDADAGSFIDIGIRGRIWALALLIVQYGRLPPDDATIAQAVLKDAEHSAAYGRAHHRIDDKARLRNRAGSDAGEVLRGLKSLISAHNRERCPPLGAGEAILELVIGFAADCFFAPAPAPEDADYRERFVHAAVQHIDTLSGYYRLLKSQVLASSIVRNNVEASVARVVERAPRTGNVAPPGLALDQLEWRARLFTVDATLSRDVTLADDRGAIRFRPGAEDLRDRRVERLINALAEKPRLIALAGPPLAGKKTQIRALLRAINAQHDAPVFNLRGVAGEQAWLPIFAISTKGLHYRGLVDKVLEFVERYYAEAVANGYIERKASDRPQPYNLAFDEAFEHLHHRMENLSALFIFTDVDAFQLGRLRHAVRDTGIRRLLQVLIRKENTSRVIFTARDDSIMDEDERLIVVPRSIQKLKVDAPRVRDLRVFVDGASAPFIPKELLTVVNAKIRGDDLLMLATLLRLAYDPSPGIDPLSDQARASIGLFLARPRPLGDNAAPAFQALLVERIADHGLLHVMVLIAVSEDGLREDSMCEVLRRWRNHDPRASDADDGGLFDRLTAFSQIAGKRFVRLGSIPRYDRDEYDLADHPSASDLVWEMDGDLAAAFLDAAARQDPVLVRQAHRLIAKVGRQRAQNKKVSMRAPYGSRATEDASRDIQAYANLLASFDTEAEITGPVPGPALRLSEDAIFSLDPAVFNPARALRFAAYCLLKEDIDHDYRLTMVFDEDGLRLELYLLLFQDLGRRHGFAPTRFPEALPAHITQGAFSREEVIELLSTIALSAFHSQRFGVVEQAVGYATRLAELPEDVPKMTRLWCSRIDSLIFRGGKMPTDAPGVNTVLDGCAQGLLGVLEYLQMLRREYFPPGQFGLENIANQPPAAAKASMRLLAREAELTGLVLADRSVAKRLYADLEALEAVFSAEKDQHDPVVLSGRVARRYIRFLADDPALIDCAEPDRGTAGKILALLNVNASRLRRFSGADRIGVMLDHCRYHLVLGELNGALAYAQAANERAFSGSSSHGTKLDVLAMLAEANLSVVERELARGGGSQHRFANQLDDAGKAAHDLTCLAESLEAIPAQALGHCLAARAYLARYASKQAEGSIKGPTLPGPLGLAGAETASAKQLVVSIGEVSLDYRIARLEAALAHAERQPPGRA